MASDESPDTATLEIDDLVDDLDPDHVDEDVPKLVTHSVVPDWGVALMVEEKGDRRTYQFEDGKTRKFKEGYYELFDAVTLPLDELTRTANALRRMAGQPPVMDEAEVKDARRKGISFEDQVTIFRALYPQGFQGEAWTTTHRADEGRQLKRHREPLLALAQEHLSRGVLEPLLEDEDWTAIWEHALAVALSGDLLTAKRRKQLESLDIQANPRVAEQLVRLLWDDEQEFAVRFERFLGELGRVDDSLVCWSIATFFPAVVFPDEHMPMRSTVMKNQAAWMAPRVQHQTRPNAALYDRYRRMTASIRERLAAEDLEPRDLIDLADWMRQTLRKKHRELLK